MDFGKTGALHKKVTTGPKHDPIHRPNNNIPHRFLYGVNFFCIFGLVNEGEAMIKKLLILLFVFITCRGYAQEPLMPVLSEQDSVSMETEHQIMYHRLLSGTLHLGGLMEPLTMPEFNFNTPLTVGWNFHLPENSFHFHNFSRTFPGRVGLGTSPFLRNETVFSGSVYQLNDRFTFGGYSFGANSAFSAPFPNQGMNNFDVRGSTIFMQYNVSKNFKIETRVNVTQGPGF